MGLVVHGDEQVAPTLVQMGLVVRGDELIAPTTGTDRTTVAGPEERMDPMYMSYSQANGVPQESKLATYMNRQNPITPPSGHTQSLTKSLVGLCLDQGVKKVTPQAPEFVPGANGSPSFLAQYGGPTGSPGFVRRGSEESPLAVSPRLTPQPSPPLSNSSPTLEKTPVTPVSTYQENVGGTTYFYPTGSSGEPGSTNASSVVPTVVIPSYHVYPGTPTHISAVKGKQSGLYVSDELRLEILHRNALVLAQPDPEHYPDLPVEIDNYHELSPLEPANTSPHKHQLLGYPMSTYKATHIKTGARYCLRRVHGVYNRHFSHSL
uniref:Uncharacterized protein n=1 Tax=Timema poppense TaxID=170557 RepID=A0A7R9H6X9_TIMPO|nr:unnamed protein product [Timema poppensis]